MLRTAGEIGACSDVKENEVWIVVTVVVEADGCADDTK